MAHPQSPTLAEIRGARDLKQLSDAEQRHLAVLARETHCQRGELVWAIGDSADGVFLLLDGFIHVQMLGADGDLVLTGLVSPGAIIGEAEAFTGERRRFNQALAAENCRLLWLPLSAFLHLAEVNTDFARHWLRVANRKFLGALHQINSLRIGSASARLARMLLLLSQWRGGDEPDMALSQETIGQYVGLSRQVVSSTLSDWQKAGLISKGYGRVRLEQPDALEKIANETARR